MEQIEENLSNFKQVIGAEFKDDLMLQMYIKHKVSSIFNKVNLCQIFSHFIFWKRSCDSVKEVVIQILSHRMCSQVYPNCVIDKFHLFDEIIIDDRFSSKFKAFFLLQYCMYLDIKYLYHKFVDSNKSKSFGCMNYESRKNSRQVITSFLNVFIRVYINNAVLILNELQRNPEVSFEQCYFFQQKGNQFAYDLLISFCSCVNLEPFEKIYKNFVPVKDYDSHCFKIVNEHLKYLDTREQYYLKHRRENDFDEKRFDLIWLCPSKLQPYLTF